MTTILISGSRNWKTNSDYIKIKEELQKYPKANIIVGDGWNRKRFHPILTS